MGNYVFIYTGGEAPTTEEEGKAVMDAWMVWFGSMGDAVVDMGTAFGPAMTVSSSGTSEGAASTVGGYSVISAPDMAAAMALASGCPHLGANGAVEVFEALDMS
jgi:hypothetical protein